MNLNETRKQHQGGLNSTPGLILVCLRELLLQKLWKPPQRSLGVRLQSESFHQIERLIFVSHGYQPWSSCRYCHALEYGGFKVGLNSSTVTSIAVRRKSCLALLNEISSLSCTVRNVWLTVSCREITREREREPLRSVCIFIYSISPPIYSSCIGWFSFLPHNVPQLSEFTFRAPKLCFLSFPGNIGQGLKTTVLVLGFLGRHKNK